MEISDFKLLNRHDADSAEKCPRCLQIFQNFMIIDDEKLGCLKCGTIFVMKEVRDFVRMNQKEILKFQNIKYLEPKQGATKHYCVCGFEAKDKRGLKAHQRFCKNA